ncbi:hypothetical protein HY933_04065 [Candidatus Falkowbacteria bacterium]|nr:hypothetical protein [Candidatus Falkowbacteria bacterium]
MSVTSKKWWWGVLLLLFVVFAGWALANGLGGPPADGNQANAAMKVVLYKSPTCGCCGNYVGYLKSKKYDIEIKNVDDINTVKAEYSIPAGLSSCHTSVIGDYVVEGHVPIEAIDKLLTEKPDILGIALAGMPAGSPGMPGQKTDVFTIYSIAKDGSSQVFMEL